MRKPLALIVFVSLFASSALARAPNRKTVRPVRFIELKDDVSVAKAFSERTNPEILERLAGRQWKPSQEWLATEGAKYGRLLVMSDLHISAGVDPVTQKTSALEHWLPEHDVDLPRMIASAKQGLKPGEVLTILGNGDLPDFMLNTSAPRGKSFRGGTLEKPANTPYNNNLKLEAIRDGHAEGKPPMLDTLSEFLLADRLDPDAVKGRFVLGSGNHDQALLSRAVLVKARGMLTDALSAMILQKGLRTTDTEARALAKQVVREQVEFAPNVFIHGDVVASHGHDNDSENIFDGAWFDRHFSRQDREGPLVDEATGQQLPEGLRASHQHTPLAESWGRLFVQGVYNGVEERVPWGASGNASKLKVALTYIRSQNGLKNKGKALAEVAKGMAFVYSQGGHGTPADEAALRAQDRADIGVLVDKYNLVAKINEIRQNRAEPMGALTRDQLVDRLAEYREAQVTPTLSNFPKGQSWLRRLARPGNYVAAFRDVNEARVAARELPLNALLFDLGLKTRLIGHDHAFRDREVAVGEPGHERPAQLLDDNSTVDRLENGDPTANEMMNIGPQTRGAVLIDFDAEGSHPHLVEFDRAAGTFKKVSNL